MSAPAQRVAAPPGEVEEGAYSSLPMSVLATGDRRLEAEAYLTGGHGMRLMIEASGSFSRLGDIAHAWQPSRLKGILVESGDGIPFFAATQVFDIRPTPRKWVAPAKTPDLAQRFVQRGWILVTCSGSVGDPMVAFAPHLGAVISHDLLRLEARDPKDRGYLYAFLRSASGRLMLRSSKYGSVVKHLEPEHVVRLPIPTIRSRLRDELDEQINRVFSLREQAFFLTKKAESLYSERFDAVSVDRDEGGYGVRASEMFSGGRRLDADYYNRDAAGVDRILQTANADDLGNLVQDIVLPNRFKRIFVTGGGDPYVSSEQIYKVNPEITKRVIHGEKKSLSDYMVKEDSLLVARSGQTYGLFGSVVLANARHEGKVISEDIIRVVPSREPEHPRPGYLTLALGHPTLGRPLILRLAFGSSIPHLAPKDLAMVPIPRLEKLEDEIADCMEGASALRMEADQIEDAAVRLVEPKQSELSAPDQP